MIRDSNDLLAEALSYTPPTGHQGGKRIAVATEGPLTVRETDVIELVAQGFTNKEIGDMLGIGSETVKTHIRKVLSKKDARSRAHAVAICILDGTLDRRGIMDGKLELRQRL